ncbi:type I restriction endonuclease subunit R [Spiroplasma sp. SV19]|uniref:type I restriction endonuclease subunit R n=1 Tax=Spiroplasma sp. SV19 TaxID=2570468 RepID=UPI0024B7199E|nr:type I restriction endonuclease subunit R [Spiroplasma sp. SV19]WHQ37493.1 HsdR family type I site-specific deoxyribonuclease [Spiroplasma sp. SV19]
MLEKEFEAIFINKLIDNGYEYLEMDKILEKRGTIENILLLDLIEESIKRLNPRISQKSIHDAIKQIKATSSSDLIIANEAGMDKIINGIKVFDNEKKMIITCKIVDFDDFKNNKFIVTNQFKMLSTHPTSRTQIVDIVIFLNGLPIIIGELKNPDNFSRKTIELAYDQLQNYQIYLKDLFVFNCFNFISDKFSNKYGTITSSYDRFFNWFDKSKHENLLDNFINGLLSKEIILDIIKNFLFFTIDNKNNLNHKIIAGHHQYQGVNSAINRISQNKDNKGGIFWHTQGSGKSFSMVFLTKKYIDLNPKATILVITDRKDLDFQLADTFINSKKYLGQEPERIESIKELKEKLNNKRQNGIYLSTIQKFTDEIGVLSTRDDILIIADEAHRSHNLDLNFEINKLQLKIKEGNAQRLRKAFTNAVFVGFTGTPIEQEDRSTKDIFGEYISKYLMSDAIKDGTIVDIFYEPRKKELHRDIEEFEKIDNEYELIKQKYKSDTFIYEEAVKTLGLKLNTFEKLIENDGRIEAISSDFIKHYKSRINILKGKAMFIVFNRKCAIKYYKEIIKQAPELEKHIKVIMTANKQADAKEVLELIGRDEDKKVFAKEFKDPESDFKIAIVVDMWLTGFDVPCLDVIYIDKWLKMHNLMQAVARVNRVYNDAKTNKVKSSGLIVDYIGLWKNLNKALDFYNNHGDEVSITGKTSDEVKEQLLTTIDEILNKYFSEFKEKMCAKQDNEIKNYMLIEELHNHLIKNNLVKSLIDDSKGLTKMLSVSLGILNEIEINATVILIVLRKEIINFELGKIDVETDVRKISTRINNAIICKGNFEEKDYKPVSLNDLINHLSILKTKTTNLEYNAELIKITAYKVVDELKKHSLIRAKKLSEKIDQLINQLKEGHISLKEFKEILTDIAAEVVNDSAASKLNLSEAEYSFYELISQEIYTKKDITNKELLTITHEIYDKVKNIITDLWRIRPAEKSKVKTEIKLILIKHKFPKESYSDNENSLRSQLTRQIEELVENDFEFE